MDAHQPDPENPFGMDEQCTNCGLCESRTNVVHGYGDVGGEFLFIAERPHEGADKSGIPFTGDEAGRRLQWILGELGFVRSEPEAAKPDMQNAFCTYLTRCRNSERRPTSQEVDTCEPYLNAEIRMINPQIIVPIGQRVLESLAMEYTTRKPESFDIETEHATTIRGRGFELIPMLELEDQTETDSEAFIEHVMENVFSRDYRQTKGRQSR